MIENLNEALERFNNLVLEARRAEAVDFIRKIAASQGYRNAITFIVEPSLQFVGELWMKEKVSLAQGYVASKIAEDILSIAVKSDEWENTAAAVNPPVVLANIEDDYHGLGRKMVASFLKAYNWEVTDLGNDVPAADILDAATKINASVIGVSAMMYTTAVNIKKVRELIDSNGLTKKIKLAVGGAVFKLRPGLVEEVGGDGTAHTAIDAPALFSRLVNDLERGK